MSSAAEYVCSGCAPEHAGRWAEGLATQTSACDGCGRQAFLFYKPTPKIDEATLRRNMLRPVLRLVWEDEHPIRWAAVRASFAPGCSGYHDGCADCARRRKAYTLVNKWLGPSGYDHYRPGVHGGWDLYRPNSPEYGRREEYYPINGYTIGFHQHFDLRDECRKRGCEMIAVFGKFGAGR